MVFKNKKFDKGIEEYIAIAKYILDSPRLASETVHIIDDSSQDYDSILQTWNNTVPLFSFVPEKCGGIIIGEKLKIAIIVVKANDFIYSLEMPKGIRSISGFSVYAVPGANDHLGFTRIVNMLYLVASGLITDVLKPNDQYIKPLVYILTTLVTYQFLHTSRNFAAVFKKKNDTEILNDVLERVNKISGDNFSEQIIGLLYNSNGGLINRINIPDTMNQLIYENKLLTLFYQEESEDEEQPSEISPPIEEFVTTSDEERLNVSVQDAAVPNYRMFVKS